MNSNVTASRFLQDLRQQRSDLHIALEELPLSKLLISTDLTKSDYILYLTLMYDIILDLEQEIYPLLNTVITDIDSRYKSEYIAGDLRDVCYTDTISATDFKLLSTNLTEISTGFALGIMYVIEGSTLGGRVILKNIQSVLGFDEGNGARYFAGYGNITGSSWKKFLEMIVNYQEACFCGNEIIAGANYAFNAIAKHLKENSPL